MKKAKSTTPKMPKSQKFIPLNPIHRIQLSRSGLNTVDFLLYPKKISGSDPGNLAQPDIPNLTLVQLLVQISADIAIIPIILTARVKRVKSVPLTLKKLQLKRLLI